MFILQFEHPVMSFEKWKKVFDSDPLSRQKSGVRAYRISCPADNGSYVIGELEFDSEGEAQEFLVRLRALWQNVQGKLIENSRGRVVEVVEQKAL